MCSGCGERFHVLKTRQKTVMTMHVGEFIARETLFHCVACKAIYAPRDLLQLVPERCRFGYDVLVYIGRTVFLKNRNDQEIIDDLEEKNIRISAAEIDHLARKFIVYLALAHRRCAERIRKKMALKGGYILHLDGTSEGGGPVLLAALDAIMEIVLGAVKLPSEEAEKIVPFLKEIKEMFGDPLASVHDMGAGIMNAVHEVFPGMPDFICHWHFLRDIGTDFLSKEYDTIRKRLRTHSTTTKMRYRAKRLKGKMDENPSIVDVFSGSLQQGNLPDSSVDMIPTISAYSLIMWALEGKNYGDGYGFPFDRPHLEFARRLRSICSRIDQIKDIYLRGEWEDNGPLYKVSADLRTVMKDKVLWQAVETMESKVKIFDRLRRAMRIAPQSGRQGLNYDGTDDDIRTIEKSVTKFRQWLTSRSDYSTNKEYQAMIAQIDKYWKKLFADPIVVETPSGKIRIQPQRTNNIMERFFRDLRRAHRRKTGNDTMSRTLRSMLAETPLVRNLENPEYMALLLGSEQSLEDLFAQIDPAEVRRGLELANKDQERIPAKIRRLIAEPTFPEMLPKLFAKGVSRSESNRSL